MPPELLELGPERYALLAVAVGWGVLLLVWVVAQLGRVRLPAPLFWLAPAAMLLTGSGASMRAQQMVADTVATAGLEGPA
ncbi:MAG: hypothetical protein KC656_00725, partial [Myxococcales bacterium]|nr:hypothetical protein [Myxococcales bacterium]